jgi:hypothetical protein
MHLASLLLGILCGRGILAQDLPLTQDLNMSTLHPVDPAHDITHPILESALHTPLTEQYIWTRGAQADDKVSYTFPSVEEKTEPHYFRASFQLSAVPSQATLYLAGPRSVIVWINGQLAEKVSSDVTAPLGMHVFAADVQRFLHAGRNTIAITAVRGRGVTGFANSALVRQQTFGQVLVAKIVPAAMGVDAPPLLQSDTSWRSVSSVPDGWQGPEFDDSAWPSVMSIGAIESSIELFQWNADAGLYNWPGYDGISPFLAHMAVPVATVLAQYTGRGSFEHLEDISRPNGEFTVDLPAEKLTDNEAPSLLLDFGRELTGRVVIHSDTDAPVTVSIQMGESESEALRSPYLGVNELTLAPHAAGHGPKSAFRYARVRFLGGPAKVRIQFVHVDHIYYPVQYLGSFGSSDDLLNRIWEVGAYTAHLCMQDGVWDASKRDRGRWMGDTDVSGRVIEDVFGEKPLMEDTLDRLIGPAPITQHVNGIPGYSSYWFTEVADFYRHTGDKEFLEREHQRLLQLLSFVDQEFDANSLYANKSKMWLYVDWSPDLNGDTPESRRATTLEYYRAYREAAWLLHELGDSQAAHYEQRADHIRAGANQFLFDATTGTFGPRWQTNAAAIISGIAAPAQYPQIWQNDLSHIGEPTRGDIITPYYGYYILRAMAQTGHRTEALDWMRQNWGGMLREGATSFYEAYDPSWYKEDFHSSLQADNRSGYFVSLAHGWSAGPTAWLMEEILGIQPTGPGFSTVNIRPDLAGLQWARGAEPTPHGLLRVGITATSHGLATEIDVPEGVVASVELPLHEKDQTLLLNGIPQPATLVMDDAGRGKLLISQPGHYVVATP